MSDAAVRLAQKLGALEGRVTRLEGQVLDLQSANAELRDKITNLTGNRKKMKPPTIEEVRRYVLENRLDNVNPDKFHGYYEQSGWMMGKYNTKPMKSWKLAVRNWNTNNFESGGQQAQSQNQDAGGGW